MKLVTLGFWLTATLATSVGFAQTAKQDIKDAGSDTKSAAKDTGRATKKTASLAHTTGRRLGTAANVERIMPVLNSLETNSTPSAPISSWPK